MNSLLKWMITQEKTLLERVEKMDAKLKVKKIWLRAHQMRLSTNSTSHSTMSSVKQVLLFLMSIMLISSNVFAKKIAFTFDDAPVSSSTHFESHARTEELVKKLRALKVPAVMVFANPCKEKDIQALISQLSLYKANGHIIGNHTCNHPRLDTVGFDAFSKDAESADDILSILYSGQKFFRFPFLNEGKDEQTRDKMRSWLEKNSYRNAHVSIDNDDTIVSDRINKAKQLGKKIDYAKVRELFLKHIISAAEFYEDMAVKNLGYSPKHVLLLHEIDGTVLFIDSLVKELRKRGWQIIAADEAFNDKLYSMNPKNTYAGNGIIAQMVFEKTGHKPAITYYKWNELERDLDKLLGLEKK